MATNTAIGIGIRRNFVTLGDRNFENDQTSPVQYICGKEGMDFMGTSYHVGDNLPFDVGGTSYSNEALRQLELAWNAGACYPAT